MSLYYILNGHEPEPTDVLTWARWMETADRRVVPSERMPDGARVSTVFLGVDHSFGDGEPELFESLIMGGPQDGWTQRYATWEAAEAGHQNIARNLLWVQLRG